MTTAALLLLSFYYLVAVIVLRIGLLRLPKPGQPQNLTYSVVIAARNEENNIGTCLATVLDQTIGAARFEVIVVDDRSTDATATIVQERMKQASNLSLLQVQKTPEGISPKKYAVGRGIQAARNDVIVFTDADCFVLPTWLDCIDRHFTPATSMVQGITVYRPIEGMSPLFFGLQAIDFLSHGVVSAAGIGAGLPINSNANNLAFRRSLYDDVGGYGDQGNVVSGDDDLLLQRASRLGTDALRYMADPAGTVETLPTPTLKALLDQRKRWASKTVHYDFRQRFFLSGIFLFYLTLLMLFLLSFLSPSFLLPALAGLAIKVLGEYILLVPGASLFRRKQLLPFVLPGSIAQLALVLYSVIAGVFGTFRWKGQEFARTVSKS